MVEKGKTTLLPFSPNLPLGFRGKSEFAAFIKRCALKNAAKRENPLPSSNSCEQRVVFKSQKFVLSAQNKFREPYFL